MCEAGRILNHLQYGVQNSRNTILIVGYQGEGTLGRDILEKNPIIKINGEDYKLNAEVQSLSAFSSHSDYNETLDWLKKVNTSKLKKIFLVHGDPEAQSFEKDFLITKGFKNIEIVQANTVYSL